MIKIWRAYLQMGGKKPWTKTCYSSLLPSVFNSFQQCNSLIYFCTFSSCWQVLFEDSLSTVWSAPNYCISEWHFPSWQGGRGSNGCFMPSTHPQKRSILAPDTRNFPCKKGNSELKNYHWVVVSNIFCFHPEIWGRWTHFDEHSFQMGWSSKTTN